MTAAIPADARQSDKTPIILYGFGPWMGLPDASHYTVKTEIQLRMAKLRYVKDVTGFAAAPKGKLPYIRDTDGSVVADSTFIRAHIERSRGLDLDAALKPRQRAEAWAVERMLEDHLGWAIAWFRWVPEEAFQAGPARFYDAAPAELQDDLRNAARARVISNLQAHGLGRHAYDEIAELGLRSLNALAMLLGGGDYLFGSGMSAVDATATAFLATLTVPPLASPLRDRVLQLDNLTDYTQRNMARFFPPVPKPAAMPALHGDAERELMAAG
ncbi:MAG TPA: glutathione S-transferase family protein [Ferrovibrio sp.]|jgi:glutathione S-transferase|uniref:glutathione S-transferase family protein n=1 Tax=Ferrovibrio sp. TaxID=1917215 RepID=UPI002ECFC190